MKQKDYSCVSGFGPGAMIMTTDGEMPVEWLESGDKVITRDRGAQPILWITRSRDIGPDGKALMPPVYLRPSDLPSHGGVSEPLRLSPHHRVMIQGAQVQLNFGVEEAMAEIGQLSRRSAPRADGAVDRLTYHHIVTAEHDLIMTCGIWAETTCPRTAELLSPSRRVYEASSVFRQESRAPRMCLTPEEARVIRETVPADLSVLSLLAA